jgi:ribosomal protein S24E
MEIKSDIRNDLFKRNEIKAELEAEKNPSFDEVRKMLSEQLKKPEENIDVYGIKGGFGKSKFIIKAEVYDSKEDLEKAKSKTQKQRKKEKEDAKKPEENKEKPSESDKPVEADKPAEADKPVETPAEAPIEEKPEEEKKTKVEEKVMAEEAKE